MSLFLVSRSTQSDQTQTTAAAASSDSAYSIQMLDLLSDPALDLTTHFCDDEPTPSKFLKAA